jgi:ABC-2 type transport system ATP-binding protein
VGGDRGWLAAFPDVVVASDLSDELRLSLPAGVEPLDLLDAARRAGPVSDFGLDLPTLSELFMLAAGSSSESDAA